VGLDDLSAHQSVTDLPAAIADLGQDQVLQQVRKIGRIEGITRHHPGFTAPRQPIVVEPPELLVVEAAAEGQAVCRGGIQRPNPYRRGQFENRSQKATMTGILYEEVMDCQAKPGNLAARGKSEAQ
jgi:hypothetical protein